MISTPSTGAITPTIMFSAPVTKPRGTNAHSGNFLGAKRFKWRRNSVSSTKQPISTCASSLGISWNSHRPSHTPGGISALKRMISGHARCLRNSHTRQILETLHHAVRGDRRGGRHEQQHQRDQDGAAAGTGHGGGEKNGAGEQGDVQSGNFLTI